MGQSSSVPNYYKVTRNDHDSGSFVLISNEPPSSFSFDPSESYMVSYGIDKQTSPKFSSKTLSSITVDDAKQVVDALVDSGMVPQSNTYLYAGSKDLELCKMDGMKKTFQECAMKVGPSGLFVFHFSGHGIRVQSNEWGLAPVDFDYTHDTYLTSDVLGQWLNEVECKAKHILFTLDCCYAGGIAAELTQSTDLSIAGSFYVLSACTAYETSLVVGSLGHSIFTFFLSHAISKLCKVPGELPLQTVFKECHVCSEALSSLFIMYRSTGDLEVSLMQPQMGVINLKAVDTDGEDQVDAQLNRFQFAVELYDRSNPVLPLEDKTLAYIDTVRSSPGGPLSELNRRYLLTGRVLETAICSMMYSVAAIELACDSRHRKVTNVNLSITAFLQVVSALDMIVQDLVIPESTFFMSWLFYKEVLVTNGVNVDGLLPLYQKLSRNMKFYMFVRRPSDMQGYQPVTSDGDDLTDSAEMNVRLIIAYVLADVHIHKRVLCYGSYIALGVDVVCERKQVGGLKGTCVDLTVTLKIYEFCSYRLLAVMIHVIVYQTCFLTYMSGFPLQTNNYCQNNGFYVCIWVVFVSNVGVGICGQKPSQSICE